MRFARANFGSFTPIAGTSGVRYESLRFRRSRTIFDISDVQDRYKTWKRRPDQVDLTATGSVFENDEFRAALASASSVTIDPIQVHAVQWTFRKKWPLFDISEPGDGNIRQWSCETPTITFGFEGWSRADAGPVQDTDELALSFTNDLFGTFTATNFVLDFFDIQTQITRGGFVFVKCAGRFDQLLTYTAPAEGIDFSWLLPDVSSVTDAPIKGNCTLDVTPGEDVTVQAMIHDFTIVNHANTAQAHASMTVSVLMRETL